MWRLICRQDEAPLALAASTYSFSFRARVSPRTSRATPVQLMIESVMKRRTRPLRRRPIGRVSERDLHDDEKEERGKRVDDVCQPHQEVIQGAAGESRRQADRNPDEHDDRHRDKSDDERDAGAVDQPAEDIAAVAVSAERITPVPGRLRVVRLDPGGLPVLAGGARSLCTGLCGAMTGAKMATTARKIRIDHPGHCQLVAAKLTPSVRPEAARRPQRRRACQAASPVGAFWARVIVTCDMRLSPVPSAEPGCGDRRSRTRDRR